MEDGDVLEHRVIALQDMKAIEAEKPEWNRLHDGMQRSTIFQCCEWNLEWLKLYADGWSPLVLRIQDKNEGRPIGYAPLMMGRGRFRQPIIPGWRELRLIGDEQPVNSDFGGLIFDRHYQDDFFRTLLKHLQRGTTVGWDVFRLGNIPEPDQQDLMQHLTRGGWAHRLSSTVTDEAPSITLPPTMDEYLARLTSHLRSDVRRMNRRIKETHSPDFLYIDDDDGWRTHRDEILTVHGQWYAGKMNQAVPDRFHEFLRRIGSIMAARNALRVMALRVRNRIVAFNMGFVHGGRYFGYQKAFLGEFAQFSPDKILMERAIEWSIRQGLSHFEMGQGGETYKDRWCDSSIPLRRLIWSNRTVRGRIQRSALRTRDIIRHFRE